MTRFTQPENWQDLLAGYALGDLSSEEAETLQQILTNQPELSVEVDRLQEILALMPYGLPEHEPPLHLKDAILTAAAAEMPARSAAPPASSQRQNLRWLGLVGSVAAAALMGLSLNNYQLRQELQTNRIVIAALQQEADISRPVISALQRPKARPFAVTGTGKAASASGTIVLDRQQKQIVMVAQNLPELPQGQAYRLWAMPQNSKTPAYCGQFNADSTGTVTTRWAAKSALCSSNPAQLLITAELVTAPPVPQGELVMKSAG
jgi:anti-sigma-K factor RskA